MPSRKNITFPCDQHLKTKELKYVVDTVQNSTQKLNENTIRRLTGSMESRKKELYQE